VKAKFELTARPAKSRCEQQLEARDLENGTIKAAPMTEPRYCHNHVKPGTLGFFAWIIDNPRPGDFDEDPTLSECSCGWWPELGKHYRIPRDPIIATATINESPDLPPAA
jgi:hypothetical protein